MSSPQIRTDEDFSVRDVALCKMPIGVHEKNVRYVLEHAEAAVGSPEAFAVRILSGVDSRYQ